MPTPTITRYADTVARVELVPRSVSSTMAISTSVLPTMGQILYRPVRATSWPTITLDTTQPADSGISSAPELVALEPSTSCMYTGA